MSVTSRRLLWTSAALTALALPGVVRAQQPLPQVQVSAPASKADKLDARAEAYERSGLLRDFGRAARLREQAAALRAPEDSAGFRSLRRAAALRYGIGDNVAARDLMERAGDQAIARGDVFNAATAYIDAAYVAAAVREPERVRHLVTRGTLLMRSPLLTPEQRAALERTVAQAPLAVREVASGLLP